MYGRLNRTQHPVALRRFRAHTLTAILVGCSLTSIIRSPASLAADLPAGFSETPVAQIVAPTTMEFAPDGRLFVASQTGAVHVIKDGALLPEPFVTLEVNREGERGVVGLTFDPRFDVNQWVYVTYTATTPDIHQRVSRFTAAGDVALAGSERVIWDFPAIQNLNRVAGAIHFGPDGMLYVAHGDNALAPLAQQLTNQLGKIIRITPDGIIPTDNPFYTTATGNNRAIWALGLRNPFNFEFQPGTGRMFINDPGQDAFEEINEGAAGANYGWPVTEGPTTDDRFTAPILAYPNGEGSTATGCAITGSAFYDPPSATLPAEFLSQYFYADLCEGWIRHLDPATNTSAVFATGFGNIVDVEVSSDGDLYVLGHAGPVAPALLVQVTFAGPRSAPTLRSQPPDQTVMAGEDAVFSVAASGSRLLTYQWQRDDVDIEGATSPTLRIPAAAPADNGARFRVHVRNDTGTVLSEIATLTVVACSPTTPGRHGLT